jgi:hypothetical protein
MSDFDQKYFHHLLTSIDSKQQTIKSISTYMYLHRETSSDSIVSIFKDVFFTLSDVNSALFLFYVLHELFVLSASKLKLEYIGSIGSQLPSIIDYLSIKCDDLNLLLKVNEIIEIWDHLMIFSSTFLNHTRQPLIKKVR